MAYYDLISENDESTVVEWQGQKSDILIDQRIFDLYGLTPEERAAISYIDFHSNKDDEADDDE